MTLEIDFLAMLTFVVEFEVDSTWRTFFVPTVAIEPATGAILCEFDGCAPSVTDDLRINLDVANAEVRELAQGG